MEKKCIIPFPIPSGTHFEEMFLVVKLRTLLGHDRITRQWNRRNEIASHPIISIKNKNQAWNYLTTNKIRRGREGEWNAKFSLLLAPDSGEEEAARTAVGQMGLDGLVTNPGVAAVGSTTACAI